MIFVTVGTNEARFDRLLLAVGELQVDEPIVAQCGASAVRPANAECIEYLGFDELAELVRRARVVVTHGGVGSIMVSLDNGRRPVVVPRLHRFAEAVDDHQLTFGRRFADVGLVTLVEDVGELPRAIADGEGAVQQVGGSGRLADDVRAYISAQVERASADATGRR